MAAIGRKPAGSYPQPSGFTAPHIPTSKDPAMMIAAMPYPIFAVAGWSSKRAFTWPSDVGQPYGLYGTHCQPDTLRWSAPRIGSTTLGGGQPSIASSRASKVSAARARRSPGVAQPPRAINSSKVPLILPSSLACALECKTFMTDMSHDPQMSATGAKAATPETLSYKPQTCHQPRDYHAFLVRARAGGRGRAGGECDFWDFWRGVTIA